MPQRTDYPLKEGRIVCGLTSIGLCLHPVSLENRKPQPIHRHIFAFLQHSGLLDLYAREMDDEKLRGGGDVRGCYTSG